MKPAVVVLLIFLQNMRAEAQSFIPLMRCPPDQGHSSYVDGENSLNAESNRERTRNSADDFLFGYTSYFIDESTGVLFYHNHGARNGIADALDLSKELELSFIPDSELFSMKVNWRSKRLIIATSFSNDASAERMSIVCLDLERKVASLQRLFVNSIMDHTHASYYVSIFD